VVILDNTSHRKCLRCLAPASSLPDEIIRQAQKITPSGFLEAGHSHLREYCDSAQRVETYIAVTRVTNVTNRKKQCSPIILKNPPVTNVTSVTNQKRNVGDKIESTSRKFVSQVVLKIMEILVTLVTARGSCGDFSGQGAESSTTQECHQTLSPMLGIFLCGTHVSTKKRPPETGGPLLEGRSGRRLAPTGLTVAIQHRTSQAPDPGPRPAHAHLHRWSVTRAARDEQPIFA